MPTRMAWSSPLTKRILHHETSQRVHSPDRLRDLDGNRHGVGGDEFGVRTLSDTLTSDEVKVLLLGWEPTRFQGAKWALHKNGELTIAHTTEGALSHSTNDGRSHRKKRGDRITPKVMHT